MQLHDNSITLPVQFHSVEQFLLLFTVLYGKAILLIQINLINKDDFFYFLTEIFMKEVGS